jgi:undecaprenyl-diphosphatase
MAAISAPGYWPLSWFIVGGAIAGFGIVGLRREAIFILLTTGAGFVSAYTKVLIERPRPSGEGVRVLSQLLDFSYPSGHVVGYVSLYGFLFFLTYVLWRRSAVRTLALGLLGGLVLLIGPSRVYLGHHWASDVRLRLPAHPDSALSGHPARARGADRRGVCFRPADRDKSGLTWPS